MADESRPSRRRSRRRVLVVGNSPEVADLANRLGDRAIRANNLFDAMGEISTAPAAAPIDLLILSGELAARAGRGAIEAVQRLDPSVRLAVIPDDGEDGVSVEFEQWFDAVLFPPLDDTRLEEVVGADLLDQAAPPHPAIDPPPEAGDSTLTADLRSSTGAADAAVEAPAPGPPVAAPPGPERAALGDTDLVEAALENPDGLGAVAVELIRQQTGLDDLTLVEMSDETVSQGVIVAYRDRMFGRLRAASTPQGLQSWADWLARWLTLDVAFREYRHLAFRDDLTNAWNRRFFYSFVNKALDEARHNRRAVTVMVFDIDDFKRYNDTFGHEAGDVILKETVGLLQSVIRQGDRVCRIGGDEFAVVFADTEGPREPGSSHPESVEQIARRFQNQISRMRFPKLGLEAPGMLSISGGLATYPWDARNADELLSHADRLAMQSKRKGKNVITFGPRAGAGGCDADHGG